MPPATFAQQAVWDAFEAVAGRLKDGLDPTAEQLEHVRDAIALVKLEPQPRGFVETLELAFDALLEPLAPLEPL